MEILPKIRQTQYSLSNNATVTHLSHPLPPNPSKSLCEPDLFMPYNFKENTKICVNTNYLYTGIDLIGWLISQ